MVRNHRGRGQISIAYLIVLSIAILLVIVLAVRQVMRTGTKAWVARGPIKAGQTIDPSMLMLASVSKDAAPGGFVADAWQVVGKTAQRPIEKGSPISNADVTPPPAFKYLSEAPPEGRVVMTIRASAMSMPINELRYGDRLELLASNDAGTRVVGHSMVYLGVIRSGGGGAQSSNPLAAQVAAVSRRAARPGIGMVVAVDPSDVTAIADAQTNSALSYVLHGRSELTSGRPVEITSREASGTVELISGAKRELLK